MSTKPTLREVTRRLRQLHAAWAHPIAGGEYVALCRRWRTDDWVLAIPINSYFERVGREYIPGDGAKFDAVAAARRLLAAWRDAGRP